MQGISDTPAWWVTKANEYARWNGKTPFVIYQGAYSVVQRDLEREILPMCRHEGQSPLSSSSKRHVTDINTVSCSGVALAPFNVLARGKIRSNAEEAKRAETGENGRLGRPSSGVPTWLRSEEEKKVCDVLEEIASQVGTEHITAGTLPLPYIYAYLLVIMLLCDDSGHSVCYAQGSVHVPYNRWSESRTSSRKH